MEPNDVTLRLEWRRCNKPACKRCSEGKGHGPYWYAFWKEGGRVRSLYIGRTLPAEYDRNRTAAAHPLCYSRGRSLYCAACLGERGYMGPDVERNLTETGMERVAPTAAMRAIHRDSVCALCAAPIVQTRKHYAR